MLQSLGLQKAGPICRALEQNQKPLARASGDSFRHDTALRPRLSHKLILLTEDIPEEEHARPRSSIEKWDLCSPSLGFRSRIPLGTGRFEAEKVLHPQPDTNYAPPSEGTTSHVGLRSGLFKAQISLVIFHGLGLPQDPPNILPWQCRTDAASPDSIFILASRQTARGIPDLLTT